MAGGRQWPLGQGSVDEEPWPGASSAPEGVPPPVSGYVELRAANATSTVTRPLSGQQVCAWRSDRGAHPLALLLSVDSGLSAVPTSPYAADLALASQLSGTALGAPPSVRAGVLRITYGVGACVRVLEADLQSGSYQLPPCDYAVVEAYLYCANVGVMLARVAASLVPGLAPNPARLVATWTPYVAGGGQLSERTPFGARWVSLAGGDASGIGAGQAKLRLWQPAGLVILQDWTTGYFVGLPSQPIELSSRGQITVTNDGAAATYATVRLYLEA